MKLRHSNVAHSKRLYTGKLLTNVAEPDGFSLEKFL